MVLRDCQHTGLFRIDAAGNVQHCGIRVQRHRDRKRLAQIPHGDVGDQANPPLRPRVESVCAANIGSRIQDIPLFSVI